MNDEYHIVAVLWEDHITREGFPIPENPDELVEMPTITVGILVKETEKTMLLVSDLERFEDHDDARYTVIIKNSIVGLEKYGTIPISNLRLET